MVGNMIKRVNKTGKTWIGDGLRKKFKQTDQQTVFCVVPCYKKLHVGGNSMSSKITAYLISPMTKQSKLSIVTYCNRPTEKQIKGLSF